MHVSANPQNEHKKKYMEMGRENLRVEFGTEEVNQIHNSTAWYYNLALYTLNI